MKTTTGINDRTLLKILLGIAWIDGILEPGEKNYLHRLAQQKGLANDREIESLFHRPIPPDQCYEWLHAYLGRNPTNEKYRELYTYLSTLISSDGEVDAQESEALQALSEKPTVLEKFQNRLGKIFLNSRFLSKTFLDVGAGSDVSNQGIKALGYYARLPNLLLSELSKKESDPLLRDDMAKIYLDGNFSPVPEEVAIADLEVIGKLPPELTGTFLRNGPNPQFEPIGLYHWFDGDGMIHSIQIGDRKASYRNRYVQTEGFAFEGQADKAIWPGLMNLPRIDGPHGILMKNVANTSVVLHADKLLALWEAGEPYEITLPDLETVGPYTFDDKLSTTFTAHPKIDPATGEMMFFGCSYILPPHLHYGVISPKGEIIKTVPIDIPHPVMMHDFAITEHYSIFLDLPLAFQPKRLLEGELPVFFDWEHPARVGIMPRHGDGRDVSWFTIPPCMVIHTANAYEDGDEIVLIACRMDYCNLLMPFYQGHHLGEIDLETLKLYRWRFNLKTGVVNEEIIDRIPSEFPRINDAKLGQKMRYIYAARVAAYMKPKPLFDGVMKYDLENKTTRVHELGRGRFCGESVFAPRPGGTTEDDGWLITFVWDAVAKQSELLILDAQNVESPAIARVLIPARVPYGFHAGWFSK